MKKQALNPYLPSYEYIPDGEPYVFGDRVYIYGSHDKFNGTSYCENNYVCWSADINDLANWKYEGVIYKKIQDPMCSDTEKLSLLVPERLLFAPDVQIGTDGRYYLYYAFDLLGIMSVAVCDTPAGEYEFYGYIHYADGTLLGEKKGDPFQFDPGVLMDDDGRLYLYSGFCPVDFPWAMLGSEDKLIKGGMVIELEKDMVTVKEGPKVIFPDKKHGKGTDFEGHEFFEAPSIRKICDTYYFVYSSFNGHELCYATSKSPVEGFKYGGTIVSNADIYLNGRTDKDALNYSGNNHGSIVEINGQWYVFYHRQTNRHPYSRQGCAESITIEQDGSIEQIEITSCGLNNGPLKGAGEYEARIACNLISKEGAKKYEVGDIIEEYHPYFTQDGEDREKDPNQYIANMNDGSVAAFKYFIFEHTEEIAVKVRGNGKGVFIISTELRGKQEAEIQVAAQNNWITFVAPMKIEAGVKALYFKYEGEGSVDFMSFTID